MSPQMPKTPDSLSLLPPVFLLPLLLGALDGLVAGAGQALDEGEPLH